MIKCIITPGEHFNGSDNWEYPCNDDCRVQSRCFKWKGHEYEVVLRNCQCSLFDRLVFCVHDFVDVLLKSDDDVNGCSEIACCDDYKGSLQSISRNLPDGLELVRNFRTQAATKSVVTGVGCNARSWIRFDDLNVILGSLIKCSECQRRVQVDEVLSDFGFTWHHIGRIELFDLIWPMLHGPAGWRICSNISDEFAGVVCSQMCAAARAIKCVEHARKKLRSERQWQKATQMYEKAKKVIRERYRGACQ